jgi:multidrug resistance efflux pump
MEYEGEVFNLSAPQDKLKQLMRVANQKDIDIRDLKLRLAETERLLAEARERISRLLGEKVMAPKIKKKQIAASRLAGHIKSRKKPGEPKRTFSPEALERLRNNMAAARQARSEKHLRPET